jgi:UDP-GlcNAc:undecaprenyl-phosphate GlcNAc-1-phosphate transferase
MIWPYFFYFIIALILAAGLTPAVIGLARRLDIVDRPDATRKFHGRAVPLLGGTAIFLAYFIVLYFGRDYLLSGNLRFSHWLGFFAGGAILVIGGWLDDKYNLKPAKQIIFPILAIAAVIAGGVSIDKLSRPGGGIFDLQALFWLSPALIAAWLLGMMYTTKLLDGVDGLVTGLSAIGALIIFLFTSTTSYYQPDLAFASLILAGACLGFLIFNFNPAKIFLGEGGSLFLGYALGVLAIISGGKIAIALLIMGIPILDLAWTILRRLVAGRNPFKSADRQHLHYLLLDAGLGPKKTVLIFYLLAALFGASGLFLQSRGKLWALALLLLLMSGLIFYFWHRGQAARPKLLLHVCCATCAGYIVSQILSRRYRLVLFFYNPNIDTVEEYEKRLADVRRLAKRCHCQLIAADYERKPWREAIAGRETDPERGERCRRCYRQRLEQAAIIARVKKCRFFATTLTISPYKDATAITAIGLSLANDNLKFLDEDWRKDDGWKKSLALAKACGIYQQKYCGCEFSRRPENVV